MNISGAILAITGIVLYAIDLGHSSLSWMCPSPSHREQSSVFIPRGHADHRQGYAAASLEMLHASLNREFDDECRTVAHIAQVVTSHLTLTSTIDIYELKA